MLTQTGYTLEDVGRSLPWGALGSFLHSARPDSALAAETNPEIAEWSTIFKTNVILADLYDAVTWLTAIVAAKGSGKRPQKPEKYPRSWRKKKHAFRRIMKIKDWMKLMGGESDGGRN